MQIVTPDLKPRCFALVPCAGIGTRAATVGPKQYHYLAGASVVAHTLTALTATACIDSTLVVLAPDDTQFEQTAPQFACHPNVQLARVGGTTRAESVTNGLNILRQQGAQPHDWILVHDAARCLIKPTWIERLFTACAHDEIGGLLALPASDTLKLAQSDSRVDQTVDRAHIWLAQTPQMFRLGLLHLALTTALNNPQTLPMITDESSAIEQLGHQPKLVPGAWENIKLTWPADFELAERLLA